MFHDLFQKNCGKSLLFWSREYFKYKTLSTWNNFFKVLWPYSSLYLIVNCVEGGREVGEDWEDLQGRDLDTGQPCWGPVHGVPTPTAAPCNTKLKKMVGSLLLHSDFRVRKINLNAPEVPSTRKVRDLFIASTLPFKMAAPGINKSSFGGNMFVLQETLLKMCLKWMLQVKPTALRPCLLVWDVKQSSDFLGKWKAPFVFGWRIIQAYGQKNDKNYLLRVED